MVLVLLVLAGVGEAGLASILGGHYSGFRDRESVRVDFPWSTCAITNITRLVHDLAQLVYREVHLVGRREANTWREPNS